MSNKTVRASTSALAAVSEISSARYEGACSDSLALSCCHSRRHACSFHAALTPSLPSVFASFSALLMIAQTAREKQLLQSTHVRAKGKTQSDQQR